MRAGLFILAILPSIGLGKTPTEVFDIASPSVVVVQALDARNNEQSRGSGVIVGPDRVITNCHVVDGASTLLVVPGGRGFKPVATVEYRDSERDLCQLRTTEPLKGVSVKIGSIHQLKVGNRVFAIGAPRGLELTLSEGIVSSLRQTPSGTIIQTTAPISPGSSGGGLFDENGLLVGITTFYISDGQNLNFALPVDWIASLPQRAKTVNADVSHETSRLLRALELEELQDWPKLLAHARHWTGEYRNSGWGWFALGTAHARTNQPDLAVKAYREALRVNSQWTAPWKGIGAVFFDARKFDAAIDAYRRALDLDQEDSGAWMSMGASYFESKRYDQAIAAYRNAVRLDPENAAGWNGLGRSYGRTGEHSRRFAVYREAIRIDPRNPDYWNNLGVAYAEADERDQAISAYREALRIDSKRSSTWSNLGNVYFKSGDFSQAITAHLEALRIAPGDSAAWSNLGLAYANSQQHERAVSAYNEALRLDPENANAWFNLGLMRAQLGERSRVLDIYERLKKLSPTLADRFFDTVVSPR